MTEAAPSERPSPSKLKERTRVLVVDDEPGVRQVIRVNLVMQGHEVVEAKNGAQALRVIEENGIDLVILDLMMPKVSGWDVLEQVHQKRVARSIPIIVLSAVTTEDAKVKAFDLGASDYIVKPFAVGELLARVNRTLHERKEKQVLAEFSITDWVTGLFNRRYLELRLPQEVSRAHRYGRRLSALFFEVDQLPWLLEQRGPQFVDGILQEVTSLVRGETRACDILFRYDADYFVALLPDTDVQGATTVADRIRRRMLETEWNQEVGLSGSFGVVELQEGEDADSLLGRAEAALLEAKRAGGNSVWPPVQGTEGYGYQEQLSSDEQAGAASQAVTQASPLVEEGPATPILEQGFPSQSTDQEFPSQSTDAGSEGGVGAEWYSGGPAPQGGYDAAGTAPTDASPWGAGGDASAYGTDAQSAPVESPQVVDPGDLQAGATQQIDPDLLGQLRVDLEQDLQRQSESAAQSAQAYEGYGEGFDQAGDYEAYYQQEGHGAYPPAVESSQPETAYVEESRETSTTAENQDWTYYQTDQNAAQSPAEGAALPGDYGAGFPEFSQYAQPSGEPFTQSYGEVYADPSIAQPSWQPSPEASPEGWVEQAPYSPDQESQEEGRQS